LLEFIWDKIYVSKSNVEVTERLEDVRVHCVPYCIQGSYNVGEETQRKTPKYMGKKHMKI
jgi:hypothetical protein